MSGLGTVAYLSVMNAPADAHRAVCCVMASVDACVSLFLCRREPPPPLMRAWLQLICQSTWSTLIVAASTAVGAILIDDNSKRHRVHLAMFAKYWQSGNVKTRLARGIGEDAARDLHLLFVQTLLENLQSFGDCRTLVGSPRQKVREFEKVLPAGWKLQFQSDGDLGQRMSHFFESNQSDGQFNILIGSDTPDIDAAVLEHCVRLHDESQLVIGPSQDGGYYLIAMSEHFPQIFRDVTWSSDQVLQQTLEIAEQNSLSVSMLPEMNDVDEWGDLQALIRRLQGMQNEPFAERLLRALSAMELNCG